MVRFSCAVAAAFQVDVLAKSLIRHEVKITPVGPSVDAAQPHPLRDDEHSLPTASTVDVLADGQILMPQGMYSGIDAESGAEHLPGDLDENLPGDPDVESTLPEAYRKAGALLASQTYGPLVAEFVNALVKIEEYHAKVIYKAGPNKSAVPVKSEMVAIMARWKSALSQHSAQFGNCSDEALAMESCMTLTRCIIEPEVGKSIAQHTLTLSVELETEIRNIMMKDFELYFNEFANDSAHPCESSVSANFPGLVEGASEQLSEAMAVVAKIHSAASRTVEVLAYPNVSLFMKLEPASIASIWKDVCTSLNCEPQSWLDVMDAMQGHSAELVRLGAPARAIGRHVSSMRSAHRAVQHASHLDQIQGMFAEMPRARAMGTKVYDEQIKEAAGTVYAAIAILRRSAASGTDDLNGWWSCIGVGISTARGYVAKFPPDPASVWGIAGGLTLSYGSSSNLGKLTDTLSGKTVCWGSRGVELSLGMVAGWVPNFNGYGARVGAGFSFTVKATTCGLTLNVKATAGGTVMAKDCGCPFGCGVSAFSCAYSVGVGLTAYCCTMKIPSGEYSCDR